MDQKVIGSKFLVTKITKQRSDDDTTKQNQNTTGAASKFSGTKITRYRFDDDTAKQNQITAGASGYFSTDALPMMTYYKQTVSSRPSRRNRPTLQDLHNPKDQVCM